MRRPSSAGLSVVVAAILCALAIGAAVFSAFYVFKEPTHQAGKAWFYDLNSQELFVAPGDAIPPIVAPSGPIKNSDGKETDAGVQAVVLESADGTKKVAYLFTYSPDTKDQLENMKSGNVDDMSMSAQPPLRFVRAAEGGGWYSEVSPEGGKVMNDALQNIGDGVSYSVPE